MTSWWTKATGRDEDPADEYRSDAAVCDTIFDTTGVTIEDEDPKTRPPRLRLKVATLEWQTCWADLWLSYGRRRRRWYLVCESEGFFVDTQWNIVASLPADDDDLRSVPRRLVDAYTAYISFEDQEGLWSVTHDEVTLVELAQLMGDGARPRPGRSVRKGESRLR